MLTWVLGVVLGHAEDLQWANGVHGVHAVVQGDEDLERLNRALINDCTHLAGVGVWLCCCEVGLGVVEKGNRKQEGGRRMEVPLPHLTLPKQGPQQLFGCEGRVMRGLSSGLSGRVTLFAE